MYGIEQVFSRILLSVVAHKEVCYTGYGCYSNKPPYDIGAVALPEDPAFLNTTYMVFSRDTDHPIILRAPFEEANTDTIRMKKKTVIIAHGYLEHYNAYWVQPMINKLLKLQDLNVIFVDWEKGARFPFYQTFGNCRVVATEITHLINILIERRLASASSVHLIGFSTGAHMMGRVGFLIKKTNNVTVKRITALDPAGPFFASAHKDVRLDAEDASFVDAIHSDAKTPYLGTNDQQGHVDFYPNGALLQPGCKKLPIDILSQKKLFHFVSCSHYRAVDYFIESINNRHFFRSYQCDSYKSFLNGSCTEQNRTRNRRRQRNKMGYHTDRNARGRFYSLTGSHQPYSQADHYSVTFFTDNVAHASYYGALKFAVSGTRGRSSTTSISRKHYGTGSVVSHVFTSDKHLGALQSIRLQISPMTWFGDDWLLKKIEVRRFSHERYVACYHDWVREGQLSLILGKETSC